MNHLTKILLIIGVYLIVPFSFANKPSNNPYDDASAYNEYYENEGKLLIKLYGMGMYSKDTQNSFTPALTGNAKTDNMFKIGLGGEAASAFFISNYFAAEINLGVYGMSVNKTILNNVAQNYNSTKTTKTKTQYVYGVPLSILAQFHLAPFGGIRPYIGVGYGATFMFSQISEFKLDHGHGPVFQAGIDFVSKNDMIISLNVKQYLLKTKVTYDQSFTNLPNVTSKIKTNPLTFGIGIGISL